MKKKISIVTPSYNQGHFIEEAILSVLNQGYENFEHIIIDGGSSDSTIEILKKYPHLKWVSEADEGQSDALNKGFLKTTGDVIGWLNSDDIYLPGAFELVNQEFLNEDTDAVYGNFRNIDVNGQVTKELICQNPVKWMSLIYCYIPSTTFFFRNSIIEQRVLIDKSFHIAMDKEFFAHIFYLGYKVKKINSFIAHFRWHDSNKSIDTKEVKEIRIKEGIETLNRYSKIKLGKNKSGMFVYNNLIHLCSFYRFISRNLNIGIYR